MLKASRLLSVALALWAGLAGGAARAEIIVSASEAAQVPLIVHGGYLSSASVMLLLPPADAMWSWSGGSSPLTRSSLRSSQSNVSYLLGRTEQIRGSYSGFSGSFGSRPVLVLSR